MKKITTLGVNSVWQTPGDVAGTVISSRVRLARNLKGEKFPTQSTSRERQRIWAQTTEQLLEVPELADSSVYAMDNSNELLKMLLFERNLVSRELTRRGAGSGVVLRNDEAFSVMVNEEDHLRLQTLRPGLALRQVWSDAVKLDDAVSKRLPYATSPRWGYLTACPSNVGTGLRASVMLHLPGLTLTGEMPSVLRAVERMGYAARGLWGEGSTQHGHMVQVSNQITLGYKEEDLIAGLSKLVEELIVHEENARQRLVKRQLTHLRNQVGRAYGLLRHSHLLASQESLDLLSYLRLGLALGIVSGIEPRSLHALWLVIQPAHLQAMQQAALDENERDAARARLMRECLQAAVLTEGKTE